MGITAITGRNLVDSNLFAFHWLEQGNPDYWLQFLTKASPSSNLTPSLCHKRCGVMEGSGLLGVWGPLGTSANQPVECLPTFK